MTHDNIQSMLLVLLANEQQLLGLNQGVHWNIQGENFWGIHSMTQEHYESIFEAIDVLAEHMKAMKFFVPSASALAQHTTLTQNIELDKQEQWLSQLLAAYEAQIQQLQVIMDAASQQQDKATEDLAIDMQRVRLKMAWMVRATMA